MGRRVISAVAVACALAAAWSGAASAAATVPGVTLAMNADALCSQANVQIVRLPLPQGFDGKVDLTPQLLRAAAPYVASELAIERATTQKWSALGTPAEPAVRVAWERWIALYRTVHQPMLWRASRAARRGDVGAFISISRSIDARTGEARRLARTIGLGVCLWQQ